MDKTTATAIFFKFENIQVVLEQTRDNNWVGYPTIDDKPQKTFFIELTSLKVPGSTKASYISAIGKRGKSNTLRSFDRATEYETVQAALTALSQMLKSEEVTVPPVSRMNPPRPEPPTFLIEAEHVAVVPGPDGTMHHVIFNPKGNTVERARLWKTRGDRRFVDIDDRAGLHTRKVAVRVIDLIFDYGTLKITTDK